MKNPKNMDTGYVLNVLCFGLSQTRDTKEQLD